MTAPHERSEFTHGVTYTVAVTITVAGGKRHGTADRRARKAAARLADAAARIPGVVEVTATAGRAVNGTVPAPERVCFPAANTGQGTSANREVLDRYLDPDHELALRSLAAANAAAEERRRADRQRRLAVGCRDPYQSLSAGRPCGCVYCDPERHYTAVRASRSQPHSPFTEHLCVCGQPVAATGERCRLHRDATLVLLDGDGSALQLLVQAAHEDERS